MDEELKGAIETGDVGAVERLLEDSPRLCREREGDLSAVMVAAYYRQDAIARALLHVRGPADLFEAAALGLDDRMRQLMGYDPRTVASRSADGFTPLHLAAYFGNATTVRHVLEAGAFVEAVAENSSQVRPLHSGVAGGSLDVVEELLDARAQVEVRQHGGFTPLMGAASGGSEELVRRLLDAGADPSAKADDGRTAMDLAREHHHTHLESLLGA